MKKLIMMVAVAFAAVALNAATFSWGLSPVAVASGDTAAAGWAVYYLAAANYDNAVAAGASGIAAFAVAHALYTDATTIASGRGGTVFAASSTEGKGSYTKDQYESGFLVLFDNADASKANYYVMTAVKTSDTVGALNNDIKTDFGSVASSDWTSTAAVPEPTSGLLLLLGMAGLALRRRRA